MCGTTKLGSPPVYQMGSRHYLIIVPHSVIVTSGVAK
jgi:hypothetical protein